MLDVVGLGALNVDLIYELDDLRKIDPALRPGTETLASRTHFDEVLARAQQVGRFRGKSGGGQAANTMAALAKMGFEVGLAGKVGRDPDSDFLLDSLESVDRSAIRRDDRSGVCLCLVSPGGERTNIVLPNANDSLEYSEIDRPYLENSRFLYLSSFAGEKPFAAQKTLVTELKGETTICLDPGEIYARKAPGALDALLRRSRFLFLTERELATLAGQDGPAGGRDLLDIGPKVIVIKKGAAGAMVITKDWEFSVPARSAEVRDTTGAGDVFAAAFLAALLLNRPLAECAKIANEAAVMSVSGYGRDSYPTRQNLDDFLAQARAESPSERPTE